MSEGREAGAADPAPLGLAALALSTFLLGAGYARVLGQPPSASHAGPVLAVALAYGGVAQLLAGIWAMRERDTFAATAFTSLGALWLSWWALWRLDAASAADGHAVGLYLAAWGLFATHLAVAALRRTAAMVVVALTLALALWVLGAGLYAGEANVTRLGGWLAMAAALAASYASAAALINATFGRVVLPVISLKR